MYGAREFQSAFEYVISFDPHILCAVEDIEPYLVEAGFY